MARVGFLSAAFIAAGCSYFPGQSNPAPQSAPAGAGAPKVTSTSGLIKAMRDRYDGKYLKTLTFLQNNIAYTTTGEEQKSQWFEHLQAPGKLRIAFLPATQKSGLVQVDDRVASFDNGIRVDFRPSVNPLLLLTVDVYTAPPAAIMKGLDSLGVDSDIVRTDAWEGRPVYVVGAKAGDTTSTQMWVDREHLHLLRFIQQDSRGERTIVSDMRITDYREIGGYRVPTEFLVYRNGRLVWREQRTDIRVDIDVPADAFDQALWRDLPLPN